MKVTITADIHVGVPGRGDDIFWALNRVRDYNNRNGINLWFNLGDLTHDREVINIRDLCLLTDFLNETKTKYGQQIEVFPGNHDMFLKNSWDINSLRPLGSINCHDNISKIDIGGRRFWILPFVHYESDYMNILGKIEKRYKPGDVLLTHIGVKNATLNACFLLKSWSVVNFDSSPFRRVYTGHFHCYQQVGSNVWYPGSLIPFKFDEGDVDHGFIVYDTETDTQEFVSIWDGATKDDKTPPQYLTVDEDVISKASADEFRGNIVRVALGRECTHNQHEEIKKQLEKLGARDVRWLSLNTEEEKKSVQIAKLATSSISDMFEKYTQADKDGTEGLNIKLLLAMNKEVVSEGDRQYEYTEDAE